MKAGNDTRVRELLERLRGQVVWFVNAGGAASSSFSLSLGNKVPRATPLENPSVSEEFRQNSGELTLYVWCTWRLESEGAVASSDQSSEEAERQLQSLVGKSVESVEATGRCFDLRLGLGGMRLDVFCDHVPPEPSFDANWELVIEGVGTAVAGPGFELELSNP